MAFATVRGITYDVSQKLGRVNAAQGGGQFTKSRATAYKGAKWLGDVNAAMGTGRRSRADALTGRVVSRTSGAVLRSASTGIPVLDKVVRRVLAEKAGAVAQSWTTQFVDNKRSYGEVNTISLEELEKGDYFVPLLERIGEHALNQIVRNSPSDTGQFASSFKTTVSRATDGRPIVVVYTDDPRWKYIEYGTSKMSARAPIRRMIFESDRAAEVDQFVRQPKMFTNPQGLPWADSKRMLDFAYDPQKWMRAGRGPLRDVGPGSTGTGQYISPYGKSKTPVRQGRDKYGRMLSKTGTNKGGAHVRKQGPDGRFIKSR
jgi:hypothetical protein